MENRPALHEDHFRAGKALGFDHIKLAMWMFIGSEVMFFGGLITAFLHYKFSSAVLDGQLLNVALVGANTFILLASSYFVVKAFAAAETGNRRSILLNLGVTILLGVLFLGGQGYEFYELASHGLTLTSSTYGSGFFTLTGFHGLHVLVGVLWALRLISMRGKDSQPSASAIEIFGLYWHFVDIVWIVLFTIIYLV